VVGQLYDNPKYTHLRDSAFMLFYMGINVGAFFAPFAAMEARDWWLGKSGFQHDGSLPALCHRYLNGTLTDTAKFEELAINASQSGAVADLRVFSQQYLDVFSQGYNYAFGIAAAAMLISLLVYLFFNKHIPDKEKAVVIKGTDSSTAKPSTLMPVLVAFAVGAVVTFLVSLAKEYKTGLAFGLFGAFVTWIMLASSKEEKPKVTSLILVFFVVIFFWMSFHQNGLILTFFARDYTVKEVGAFTNLFFTLPSILAVIVGLSGLFLVFGKKNRTATKLTGMGMVLAGGVLSLFL